MNLLSRHTQRCLLRYDWYRFVGWNNKANESQTLQHLSLNTKSFDIYIVCMEKMWCKDHFASKLISIETDIKVYILNNNGKINILNVSLFDYDLLFVLGLQTLSLGVRFVSASCPMTPVSPHQTSAMILVIDSSVTNTVAFTVSAILNSTTPLPSPPRQLVPCPAPLPGVSTAPQKLTPLWASTPPVIHDFIPPFFLTKVKSTTLAACIMVNMGIFILTIVPSTNLHQPCQAFPWSLNIPWNVNQMPWHLVS